MMLDASKLFGKVDLVQDQDPRPPVHALVMTSLEVHQGFHSELVPDAVDGAAPSQSLHLEVDEGVQADCYEASHCSPNRIDDHHHCDAQHKPKRRDKEVPYTPAALTDPLWPPSRRLQQRQNEARAIHESVGHQETHRQEWCDKLKLADEDKQRGDDIGEQEGPRGLSTAGERRQRLQHLQDVIARDLLKQPWRYNEALQGLTEGGDDNPDEGGIREWIPDDVRDDHAAKVHLVVDALGLALEEPVVCTTAPENEQGHVHDKAEADGCKGPLPDVLRRVLQHIRAVRATEDTSEAWIEKGQCGAKVVLAVVVACPIAPECFSAEPSDPLLLKGIADVMGGSDQAEVEGEQGVQHNKSEEHAKLRHDVDASPNCERKPGHEGRAERLHVHGELHRRHGHGKRLHCTQAFKHRQHGDGQPVHDAHGGAEHGPHGSRDHVIGSPAAHQAAR
mmetsp:Transcript_106064/g.338636  ORF Transcript_106064/g.338636 Transcript_106064/m.338636 type:complete len:448 (+) Transcript_106064:1698-3041(+)